MSEQLVSSATSVALAIVGLALLAVFVSKNANTTNIIQATSAGFSRGLLAAEAPVLGGGGLNVAGTYSSAGYMS